MKLSRVVAGVSCVVAGLLALVACTSATAAPRDQVPTGETSSATAAPTTSDTVQLTDVAIDTDGPTSTVILTGAIGDHGTGTTTHPDGTIDPDHTSRLKLTLSKGTFEINIADLHASFADAFQKGFPTSVDTCSGTIQASAPAPIVADSGTGAYQHLTGHFDLSITVAEVDAGAPCDGTGRFLAQTILIAGTGTISTE